MLIKRAIGPLAWIVLTVVAMTYGPVLLERLNGKITPEQIHSRIVERSPEPLRSILGETASPVEEESSSPQPLSRLRISSPADASGLIREIVEKTTTQIIEKGSSEASKTKAEVTANVCSQIIEEIQKQCRSGEIK